MNKKLNEFEKQKFVEDTEVELNEIDGVTSVHARFYELSSNYYRTVGNHFEYYRNALRYLGCIKFETLSGITFVFIFSFVNSILNTKFSIQLSRYGETGTSHVSFASCHSWRWNL